LSYFMQIILFDCDGY